MEVMEWSFTTADRIRFGRDVSAALPSEVAKIGMRAVIVTGSDTRRFAKLIESIRSAGIDLEIISVAAEPDLAWLTTAISVGRQFEPEVVVGIGGGSAIDGAKALSALIANSGAPLRYLEVVGDGAAMENAPLPMIAVPTTSGTGAEVTKNAVISVPEHRRKVSLRDHRMLPELALVDPVLTIGLPLEITAATGLDALTQVIEPYLSSKSNPMTDAICREGISRAANALPKLLKGAENYTLREDMALTSVFGGMALANSGLGAVHGLAGVLGGWCGAPHGALCGRLLPAVLRVNANAISEHGDTGLETRFRDVARWLTGRTEMDGLTMHLEELLSLGRIAGLAEMGLSKHDIPDVAKAARVSSSMKGNPVPLNQSELEDVLKSSL
jgi:alcohol dehydrogenase class IV